MKTILRNWIVTPLIAVAATVSLTAQNTAFTEVAFDDSGNPADQPHLVLGENYVMPAKYNASEADRSCNFGGKVIYAYDGMDIQARYRMEITFLADHDRRIGLIADGNAICDPIDVPEGKVVTRVIDLPRHSYAYGKLVLVIVPEKGDNAVVSKIRLLSDSPSPLSAFAPEARESLKSTKAYMVDTNVDVEKVLPDYTPIAKSVTGVYRNTMSLDGVWQFSEKPSGDDWHPIQVPGEWVMQGFKVDSAGCARYRRDFEVPADWKDHQVMLRFDGVHSEYTVTVNGKKAGYHMGGMTPYEINITPLLRKGDNALELTVRSESKADMLGSLTQYAAHQMGGILRKVTMFAVPDLYISDLRIVTDLDDDYRDAMLRMHTSVTNLTSSPVTSAKVDVTLDKHTASMSVSLPRIAPGETWTGNIDIPVDAPALWDNEHPNLYDVNVNLSDAGGSIEQVHKRIGFREIEVRGTQVFVNGKAIKLRGVCRHEVHPLLGRSLSDEQWRRDAELYLQGNCNFIRTSHYPPAEEFIDYCDEMGLFVELEAPVCWIGHGANENWQKLRYDDPQYYDYILQADMETVHFYRNHPSVIMWSMANESYWNKEFAQVSEYMKKADPSRPYTFHDQAYGGFNNQGSDTPVANIHYPGPNGYKVVAQQNRPMTYGEFCHLNVYNRSELVTDPGIRSDWALALQPMWENMYATDAVLGGSIWSGIDDIFQLPDGNAVGYGAWGPIDGWRRPKPEYWDMKKIFTPVKLETESLDASKPFVVNLENRYTFTDFDEMDIHWTFGAENGKIKFELAPGQKGSLAIPVNDRSASNCLAIKFVDPRGFVADEFLIPVGEQAQNRMERIAKVKTRLKKGKRELDISGKNFLCRIDTSTGAILSLVKDGHKVLSGGPWLMALPLTGGGCYPNHNADTPVFNDFCHAWNASSVDAVTEGDDVKITVKGSYDEFEGEYTMLINANGELTVNYDFTSKIDVNPRQVGMVFETPQGYDTTFWRRNGIWSVYPDDHISRPVGTARSFYDEVPAKVNPRIAPTWPWSHDHNELGSNDFRSTRRNIWYAGVENADGNGKITAVSDGGQHWRAWKEDTATRFLVADFVTAGDELFLAGHYAPYRKPVKKGDKVTGSVTLRAE